MAHTRDIQNDRDRARLLNLDDFTYGYILCALWLSVPDEDARPGQFYEDHPWCVENIDLESLKQMKRDCEAFKAANAEDLDAADSGYGNGGHGHDFWLTRNHHGAGFWDRGYEKALGSRLTKAAQEFSETSLYMGDDGRIYLE